jgi:hypothetical protein
MNGTDSKLDTCRVRDDGTETGIRTAYSISTESIGH